jgi:integrase
VGRTGSGVELREKSIRVGFKWQGEWCRETLAWAPTPANEKRAERLVVDVRRAIAAGTFRWADFFPASKRAAAEAEAARAVAKKEDTFADVCRLYLDSIGGKSEATRDQYQNALENLWKPLLGADTPFASIQHAKLAAVIGAHPWKSPKSKNNALIPLRGAFALIYRGPRALENPLIGIGNSTVVKKLPDPLTLVERDRVLADMRENFDPRVVAYFEFAFATGMRPEEIIALRWSEVDWTHGTVRVARVRTFRGSEREGSKTHRLRDVDLNATAMAALLAMKPFTYVKTGGEGDVFEHPELRAPWHDERSQRDTYWKPALRRAGVRARRAYCTRHTRATELLMAGLKPAWIADQLGHSLQELLETYARWIPGGDGHAERAKMRQLDTLQGTGGAPDTSPAFPQAPAPQREKAGSPEEKPASASGRRDWTRTHLRRAK